MTRQGDQFLIGGRLQAQYILDQGQSPVVGLAPAIGEGLDLGRGGGREVESEAMATEKTGRHDEDDRRRE